MYSPAAGHPAQTSRPMASGSGIHQQQQQQRYHHHQQAGYPADASAAAAAASYGHPQRGPVQGHHPHPHQQQPPPGMHPAQMAAQGMRKRHAIDGLNAEAMRGLKKGKPTSRVIPPSVQRHVPESALYGQLQKDEKALDWTLARKRAELTDGMVSRPPKIKRTLRIFLSNTCANQPFQRLEQAAQLAAQQRGGQDASAEGTATPAATGDPSSSTAPDGRIPSETEIPSWTLRVEGRLLEPSFRSRASHARAAQSTSDRIGAQKFSNIVKSCVVELLRDPASYPASENIVEWHRPTPTVAPQQGSARADGNDLPLIAAAEPGLDGFEVKRKGSEPVKVRIALYISHTPERYTLDSSLAALLDIKEETRPGVISALWGYIKDRKLIDERDRRMILLDPPLSQLFKTDVLAFHHLPEVVNRLLHPANPVVLEYWVRTDADVNRHTTAYDIEVELEDWTVRARQERVLSLFDAAGERAQEVAELDDRIAQAVASLQNHSAARDFLYTFSSDPLGHLRTWLASQARDLDSILGAKSSVPGAGIGSGLSNEEMRRAETFEGAWLDEAITGHVALETARKKRDLEAARAAAAQQSQQTS
ncbi:unnamed protein product [Parajaminaea phylloscopi]